ncbi:hypothetical protein HPB47_002457 [Ixodes persulcatus]|uniref:Uncharacterized protein n=1 Tax=Ixodes persulcatus TaxID=34615 RepID=A0AC60PL50_IXOPE|nr:hypothetical protein HPB47_002457 [Ixodes persulcatus]
MTLSLAAKSQAASMLKLDVSGRKVADASVSASLSLIDCQLNVLLFGKERTSDSSRVVHSRRKASRPEVTYGGRELSSRFRFSYAGRRFWRTIERRLTAQVPPGPDPTEDMETASTSL